MTAATNFPLAKALDDILVSEIEAIRHGEPCALLDNTTEITRELIQWWFQEDYCDTRTFNFHEGQKQAILAIIYAHEVMRSSSLMELYQEVAPSSLLEAGLFGRLSTGHQHPKYAAKMATGTGKTWVLNSLLIWQYLNKVAAPDDPRFTSNFLLVAPGLIVYDRLLDSFMGKEHDGKRDFETSDIFGNQELFVPPGHRESVFGFVQSAVVTKSDIGTKVTGGGQIAITNWHLLAGKDDPDFADLEDDVEIPGLDIDEKAAVESFFPITPGTATGNSLDVLDRRFARGRALESLIDLPSLMVFNDEAHHVHTIKRGGEITEVEWQKSLNAIAATKGSRFVQVDFSATPYNQAGSGKNARKDYFPHIIVDFDLNEAMRTGLVKSLALDRRKEVASLELEFRAERDERGKVIGLSEGQRVMINAGLAKLRRLEGSFEDVDESKHPKLLIMCEDTNVTPHVVEYLQQTGLHQDDIIRVDSGKKAELSAKDWDEARERLFDVDRHKQPKVIVSVLMLREGFDVNNICVIVPLRASQASILLEQTIGRGLRLMWRGDDAIDDLKRETRNRIAKGQEPTNYFDVLFIVEHPAFIQFYDELLHGGLAIEVDDDDESTNPTGDVQSIELRDGFEEFDFSIPVILREVDEEMDELAIDPMQLPSFPHRAMLPNLISWAGRGDTFVSQDVQTGTQYGDYRVDGGVMTATGYNDYLSRMTQRISSAMGSKLTRSAKAHQQASHFPSLQSNLPQLTGWIDEYIRFRLFGETFIPWRDEQWRVLLVDEVAHHIAVTFAAAIVEHEGNHIVGEAEVLYRKISEVAKLPVNMMSAEPVRKCIYPVLPVSRKYGGLERTFIQWANTDSGVEAFVKIHEHRHDFLHHRYLKEDGMPGSYSPDFLVRTAKKIFVVETKAQRDMSSVNVRRKAKAAKNWCDRINELEPVQRSERRWHYVLLGESNMETFRARNATVSDLLEYSAITGQEVIQERLL